MLYYAVYDTVSCQNLRIRVSKKQEDIVVFLKLTFLFLTGSLCGWVLELFYRRFFSGNNPERRWINPGFLVGPYVPLYGFGLCILYLLARLPLPGPQAVTVLLQLLIITVALTGIELLAGLLAEWIGHVRLWDYSDRWGNYRGLICPLFSAAWAALGAGYLFFLDPFMSAAVDRLSLRPGILFPEGILYGILLVDLGYSTHVLTRIRKLADEYQIEVRYEELKAHIHHLHASNPIRQRLWAFALPLNEGPLPEHLRQYVARLSADGRLAELRRRVKKHSRKNKE